MCRGTHCFCAPGPSKILETIKLKNRIRAALRVIPCPKQKHCQNRLRKDGSDREQFWELLLCASLWLLSLQTSSKGVQEAFWRIYCAFTTLESHVSTTERRFGECSKRLGKTQFWEGRVSSARFTNLAIYRFDSRRSSLGTHSFQDLVWLGQQIILEIIDRSLLPPQSPSRGSAQGNHLFRRPHHKVCLFERTLVFRNPPKSNQLLLYVEAGLWFAVRA